MFAAAARRVGRWSKSTLGRSGKDVSRGVAVAVGLLVATAAMLAGGLALWPSAAPSRTTARSATAPAAPARAAEADRQARARSATAFASLPSAGAARVARERL